MFQKYIRKIITSVLLLLIGVMCTRSVALAIGIAPSMINFDNMRNGQKQAVEMTLMRTDPTGAVNFNISVSGEAAQFIDLPANSFYLSADAKNGKYTFYINPVGASNGLHTANLLFVGSSGDVKKGETGSVMKIGVGARVNFTITENQIKNYTISNVYLATVEEGGAPFLNFYINNSGNVEVRPDKINYKVQDVTDGANFKTGQILADEMNFTPPWESSGKNYAALKEPMPIGVYKVSADFYDNNNIKQSFEDLNLQVVPKGTLKQSGEFISFKLNGDKFSNNDLLKFEAVANSSGEATIEPVLYIEIKLNGKTIDLIKSDKKSIPGDQRANFVVTHRLSADGDYEADAYFEYGFQQTEHKKINFSIGNFEMEKKSGQNLINNFTISKNMVSTGISVMVVVLIAVIGWFIKKRYF